MGCRPIARFFHPCLVLKQRLSVRVLIRRRNASECTVHNARAAILRVSNGNCLEIIRQNGTRGSEVILTTILYHTHLSTSLRAQRSNSHRTTDNTAHASICDNARTFRRRFVVFTISNKVAKVTVSTIRFVIFCLLRSIQDGRVPPINGNNARVNCLRQNNGGLSLPSKSAGRHRAIPQAPVKLIMRLYVQCRSALFTKRINARPVTRTLQCRIIFPCNGNVLQQAMFFVARRTVRSPARVKVAENDSNEGRQREQAVSIASRVGTFVVRAVHAERDQVVFISGLFLGRDRYLHHLRNKTQQVDSRSNAIRRELPLIRLRRTIILSPLTPCRRVEIGNEQKGRTRGLAHDQFSNRGNASFILGRPFTRRLRIGIST